MSEIKLAQGIFHVLPDDIENALKQEGVLIEKWNKLTPIQRNEWICWVTIVKKTETRVAHIHRLVDDIKSGKKQPCCWPGCPHRRESAKKWFSQS
ncbi:MAG: YdeI/OmpD-associated family protein [Bacteroidetes bacterium]|nr:YdeI/OmpD-associated family protein [Bacteroidota bacterium]